MNVQLKQSMLADLELLRRTDFSMDEALDEVEETAEFGYDFLDYTDRMNLVFLIGDMERALEIGENFQWVIDSLEMWWS